MIWFKLDCMSACNVNFLIIDKKAKKIYNKKVWLTKLI